MTKNKENTKVVTNAKLPTKKKHKNITQDKLDPFNFKGKQSKFFGISIKYPPEVVKILRELPK